MFVSPHVNDWHYSFVYIASGLVSVIAAHIAAYSALVWWIVSKFTIVPYQRAGSYSRLPLIAKQASATSNTFGALS